MTMLPTYAQALLCPTVTQEEAALIASFPPTTVAGWPTGAPQRDLVTAEAQALQFEMIQRVAVAYAASPSRILQLAPVLVSLGYAPADAATIQSAWVDIVLDVYQTPRIQALPASWQVGLVGVAPYTVDNTSTILVQASDGTIFQCAQPYALSGTPINGYKVQPTFQARVAGASGNVVPNSITSILQAPAGIQLDFTFQQLVSPGRDAQSDVAALTYALGRWGTLSSALTASGWQYVIQTAVPTLTGIFVDDTTPGVYGSLAIALSNAAGPALASEVAAAQAAAVPVTIAGGPVPTITAAAATVIDITAKLATNGSNSLAAAQGAAALIALGPGPRGSWLYLDAVIATLMGVAGVTDITFLSMTADVQRPAGGVLVITPSVTAS